MTELSRRDALFNALLDTVKEHSSGMEIGLVRVVLNEVDYEIGQKAGRNDFDTVRDKLKAREPRG